MLCGESEEDLRGMVFRRRDIKVNADKTKVMVLGRKEGLESEVLVNLNTWDVFWMNQV